MQVPISSEKVQRAIHLYKNGNLLISEISNLTDLSISSLTNIYRKCFENGTLKPRRPEIALKPRQPKGMGKPRYIPKGGNPKKFTEEQEKEIAIDYYVNDFSVPQLKQKWDIHPVQLQRIRKKFKDQYPPKSCVPKKFKRP